jgi:hypothetical protein
MLISILYKKLLSLTIPFLRDRDRTGEGSPGINGFANHLELSWVSRVDLPHGNGVRTGLPGG